MSEWVTSETTLNGRVNDVLSDDIRLNWDLKSENEPATQGVIGRTFPMGEQPTQRPGDGRELGRF